MKRSTEEFRVQNELLKTQLEIARSAQVAAESKERLAAMPFIRYLRRTGTPENYGVAFENVGGDIYDLELTSDSGVEFRGFDRFDMWRNGEEASVVFLPAKGVHPRDMMFSFTFSFTTKLGLRDQVRFEVGGNRKPIKKDKPK